MFFLADGDMAMLTPDGVHLTDFNGRAVKRQVSHILWDPIMAEKGGYKHFMLKEIFEQPRAVRDTTLGRVGQETGRIFLDEMDISPKEFREFQSGQDRGVRHQLACRAGRQVHDREAGARSRWKWITAASSDIAIPSFRRDMLTVVISQSGETADTLAAQREAKQKGSKTLAICNVVGSMITREAAGTLLTHAGPEIGVAVHQGLHCRSSRRCSSWPCIWARCARRCSRRNLSRWCRNWFASRENSRRSWATTPSTMSS